MIEDSIDWIWFIKIRNNMIEYDRFNKEEEKGYHNHENKIKKDEEYFHHALNKII